MNVYSPFMFLSTRLKGSTVNMNIMGWVYSRAAALVGAPGHTALGASLMIGNYLEFPLLPGVHFSFEIKA